MSRLSSCAEVSGLLEDYIDETAPPLVRRVIQTHLDSCAGCRDAWRERMCVRQLLRQLPREGMPVLLRHRLLAACRNADRTLPFCPATPPFERFPPTYDQAAISHSVGMPAMIKGNLGSQRRSVASRFTRADDMPIRTAWLERV
jgi:hypothetical protein